MYLFLVHKLIFQFFIGKILNLFIILWCTHLYHPSFQYLSITCIGIHCLLHQTQEIFNNNQLITYYETVSYIQRIHKIHSRIYLHYYVFKVRYISSHFCLVCCFSLCPLLINDNLVLSTSAITALHQKLIIILQKCFLFLFCKLTFLWQTF